MRYEDIPWDLGGCVGTDAETWFPDGTNANRKYNTVQRICDRCEIKQECLEWALENHEFGWWGGQYFSNREGMKADDNECAEPIHAGDNGGGVLEVRSEGPGEMPPVVGDAEGIGTDSASLRA